MPKRSRPVLLGGAWPKYGSARSVSSALAAGLPRRARSPSRSCVAPGSTRHVTASITATPGPMSNASAPRLVPDGLPVGGDERQVARTDVRGREQLQHGARESLGQRDVQDGELLRAATRDRLDDLAALGRRVGFLAERDQRRGGRPFGQPHERRRDPIERCARHQADGEALAHARGTGGGSPTARRTNPPACSSRRLASSFPTPAASITIASFTLPPAAVIAARAWSRSTPQHSMTMRWPRSRSLSLVAIRSTIRLPYTLPSRIMAPVVMELSTSLVAVPAFIRVDPVSTSGPTFGRITTSHVAVSWAGGSEHDTSPVFAPSVCARDSALRTNGVVPLAAIPMTTSLGPTRAESTAAAPALTSSSAPSALRVNALGPPAMIPRTISGGVPNVGGHSAASNTPRRPEVPAPT